MENERTNNQLKYIFTINTTLYKLYIQLLIEKNMSKNFVQLFYRNLCKDISPVNRKLYKDYVKEEILKFKSNNYTADEKLTLIKNTDNLIKTYLKMKHHISKETQLLTSYNINIPRDGKRDIENVAHRCGLQI